MSGLSSSPAGALAASHFTALAVLLARERSGSREHSSEQAAIQRRLDAVLAAGRDGVVLHTFFTDETFVRRSNELVRIEKPADAEVGMFGRFLLLRLRSDWMIGGENYPAGSLLAEDFDSYLKGERNFAALFKPAPQRSHFLFVIRTLTFEACEALRKVIPK